MADSENSSSGDAATSAGGKASQVGQGGSGRDKRDKGEAGKRRPATKYPLKFSGTMRHLAKVTAIPIEREEADVGRIRLYRFLVSALALAAAGCGVYQAVEQRQHRLEGLPVQEFIQEILGPNRPGGASFSGNESYGRVLHYEYQVELNDEPANLEAFTQQLCDLIKAEIERRSGVVGGGQDSSPDGCSFMAQHDGMFGWVTVTPLLKRGSGYWMMVTVDEW